MAENLQNTEPVRGKNVLEDEQQESALSCFLAQLNDPLIFILFVAAAISFLLREIGDMVIILAVVMLNAVIGVIQEGRAKRALDALKELTSPHALIREGTHKKEIPAADLIPGDIVILEAGRQVPADLLGASMYGYIHTLASSKRNVIGPGWKIAVPARFVIGVPVPVRVAEWVVAHLIANFA